MPTGKWQTTTKSWLNIMMSWLQRRGGTPTRIERRCKSVDVSHYVQLVQFFNGSGRDYANHLTAVLEDC